ncbi:MAG: PIN domain nuclease [Clostridiales bacterium]|jgi:predicted nucleic acid-binding protein|nr:PIN domain nuclease [Clostridiales bacterium]
MKKFKLYLDTSVISHLDQQDAPDKMAETRLLWDKIKAGVYDVVISDVDIRELNKCEEKKRTTLYQYLDEITYIKVDTSDRADEIAERLVDLGILKQTNFADCRHIANAIVTGCDAIVSWNFKHIVNMKTQNGVKAIALLEGYDDLLVVTPSFLIGGDEDDTL